MGVGMTVPVRRGAVIGAGLAIVLAYAGLAWFGGHDTVLARRPLLDGLLPAQPYRWVDPPPELAATNQAPSAGRFTLDVNGSGVVGQVLITSDNQVTLVVGSGSVPTPAGTTAVAVAVDPRAPGGLPDPGKGRIAFGNAYEIRLTSKPSGKAATTFSAPWSAILTYPVTTTLQSSEHELLYSPDGRAWRTLPSKDSHAQQQVEAKLPGPGFLLVAGVPNPAPVTTSRPQSNRRTLVLVGLAVAIAALAVGVALILRSRGGPRTPSDRSPAP